MPTDKITSKEYRENLRWITEEHKRDAGIYNKFFVLRTDERDKPGEKHHGCRYFVLDLDHDKYASAALAAYAAACSDDFPQLAMDLVETVNDLNGRRGADHFSKLKGRNEAALIRQREREDIADRAKKAGEDIDHAN